MRNRMKEDEKIERTIRGLLKLPENRRCINCNSLGPQYVCTTFLTFVCTNCSGVHREFTHRVKSVSVAKFTAEEVNALQAGGNERARQIYFKAWDPQRHGFPESSNMHRLRDFVKHVYVDRKYSGEKGTELPRLRLSEKESNESKMVDVYRGGSSPYAGDKSSQSFSARSSPGGKRDDKHFKGYYDESRSPRFLRENLRHGGFKRSPVRFEIVDNRVRDDRFASHRFAQGEFKIQSLEPDSRENSDRSRSPVVRSIREILGENVPVLQIDGVSKDNDRKDADGPDHNQESANGNPLEHEIINSQSLIDFSIETEIPDAAVSSQAQQVSSSNNSSIWPSFDPPTKEKSSQAPNAITLESLLFGLSVPSTPPASDKSAPGSTDVPSTSFQDSMLAASLTIPTPGQQQPKLLDDVANVPEQFSYGDLPQAAATGVKKVAHVTAEQPFAYPVAPGGPSSEQTIQSIGASNNESRPSSVAHYAQESLCISAEQSSQSVSSPVQDTSSRVESQTLRQETNSSTRKELPVDLFTASYSTMSTPVSGWGSGPPGQMGFNMLYSPNTMPVSAFPVPAKSTNPFDIKDERIQFPSMAPLQGALPNVSAPTTLVQASSLGTYPSPSNAPQSTAPQPTATASVMPPRSPSFESALSSAGFMGQGVQSSMLPSRSQEMVGFGSGLQPTSRYSAPTTPSSSSMGGNPFG